jgi:hypothetical protein
MAASSEADTNNALSASNTLRNPQAIQQMRPLLVSFELPTLLGNHTPESAHLYTCDLEAHYLQLLVQLPACLLCAHKDDGLAQLVMQP